jgi:D-alanyl-D-alanine carboxypeptidase/D-alanyl-D-alanine-endopeptidase (penicillin-binding protein 4)
MRRAALAGALFLTLALRARAGDDLAARIETVIHGPDYQHARWGLLLVDSASGETVYSLNPDQLFLPASTTKLYSCSAALEALGSDYRFETPVYQRGTVKDGQLWGDLILVAQGDLTLGGRTDSQGKMAFRDHDHTYANGGTNGELTDTDPLAGLKSLARQVAAAGIRGVRGEVLIDDRLFVHAQGFGSGPGAVTPILVNDNVVDFLVTPAAEAGKPATVSQRPETSYVQVDNQVETVAAGKPTEVTVYVAGDHSLVLRGTIAAKHKPLLRIFAVDDPAAYARALFIEALRRDGVKVAASPLERPTAALPDKNAYAGLKRVALFTSPPLSEAIKVTLKVSHNLYASTLPLLVAVKQGKKTLADGLHQQRTILAGLGVDGDSISFGGGAGGANADAVTPRASVTLLRAMAKRPAHKALHEGLPVLGVDGTLGDVVPADSPARGKVHAKTGTLMWHDTLNDRLLLTSKALAGTMTAANGRQLTLAIYVNMVPLPRGITAAREGKVIGKLCEIIYQSAPRAGLPVPAKESAP